MFRLIILTLGLLGLVNSYFILDYSDKVADTTEDFNDYKQPVVNVPTLLHIHPIFFLVLLVIEISIVLVAI
jgi:hypothetical protein